MTSWLGNKFAKAVQTNFFTAVTVLGAGYLGASFVHDDMTGALDYMDNTGDVKTVQMFEGQIGTLTTLGAEYTDLSEQRGQAYLTSDNPTEIVAGLQEKMDGLSSDISQLSNRVERELYLNQAIGEDDFEDLAGLFNTAISSDKINTNGAEVLQECQLGLTSVQNRDIQKNAVKDCMEMKAPLLDDPTVVMFSIFGSMLMSGLGFGLSAMAKGATYQASRYVPGTPRIVQAAQNAVRNRRLKKNRKLN